ncbi:MAG: GTP pyrophosphokinase family protein [Oscillospiraceae bacterium]|nr:GTP pyrophosphokinase family protein [Oscillospiraceae bacterium]
MSQNTDRSFLSRSLQELLGSDTVELSMERMQELNKLMSYYRCAMMSVVTKFNVLNEQFSLQYDRNPITGIKSRLKTLPSIMDKLERRGFPLSLESIEDNLNDVAGVRVICSFEEDVHMLSEALMQQDDIQLLERKDYIRNPKPNGYRSLHLIVSVPIFLAHEKKFMRVEIQLRTLAMDFWATLEHQLRYKKDFDLADSVQRELYTCASLSAELDQRMDGLRQLVQEQNSRENGKPASEAIRWTDQSHNLR